MGVEQEKPKINRKQTGGKKIATYPGYRKTGINRQAQP